jgi:lysophospholipase L1-like esterase
VVGLAGTDNDRVSFQRYVAIGDSFTEGVGDADPTRPNGLRGWADRVAEVLGRDDPSFGYANLAIRGRKLPAILDQQLEPALALDPDLVTIYAGANDILRPKVDVDGLVERYDAALGRLAATGARLVVFTAFDPGGSAIYRPLRGRFALYNELVRTSARGHGATIVDFWTMREYRDWRYWDADRMHLGPAGHQRMAIEVLDTLGVDHGLAPFELEPLPVMDRRQRRDADLAWARAHAAPWVQRRLRGTSSGDGLAPRRPVLAPVATPVPTADLSARSGA